VVWLEQLHQLVDIDNDSDTLILVHTAQQASLPGRTQGGGVMG